MSQSLPDFAQKFNVSNINSIEFAKAMDEQDELREFQKEFHFPKAPEGKRTIYVCGNSLGLQPVCLRKEIERELTKWADEGVEGHFTGDDHWCEIESHPCYKGPMSRLVGASESEVCFMNTLSVNLHLMLIVFYKPTPERYKIMIEKKAFPSDYHIVLSQLQLHGYTAEQGLIEIAPREGETTVRLEDIEAILEAEGDKIATVMFSGVQYFTGQFFNIPVITKMAKAKGCRVGFDLAHAVGNVPLHLHDWGVDFACWCMYKYMNSGPGAVAGCFVHEEHGKAVLKQVEGSKYPQPELHRLAGWWGHRQSDRFQMEPVFIPAEGVDGFRLSNPPVMSMACIKASLSVFDKAGIHRLRQKSLLLTAYLEHLLKEELHEEVQILTPANPEERGCQLSITFSSKAAETDPDKVLHKMGAEGIIGDVRKPNVIRVAPTPLYNSFLDVYEFVKILTGILKNQA